MLPAACLVISFFPSTAPYLLLWQLNATRGANEIPSHIEIQITHQLDEQANVEYIGTAISKCDRLGNGSTRGGLVRCIGDKLSSVGQANRTEQNRSKEEEVTKKMFNLLKDHRVSSDVNDDKNAPLDYLGGRSLFFFLFRGGDENHSLSIPFRKIISSSFWTTRIMRQIQFKCSLTPSFTAAVFEHVKSYPCSTN